MVEPKLPGALEGDRRRRCGLTSPDPVEARPVVIDMREGDRGAIVLDAVLLRARRFKAIAKGTNQRLADLAERSIAPSAASVHSGRASRRITWVT